MKVGTITTTNQKGQVVIPKEIRKSLGIGANAPLNIVLRGNGIYIYPIAEVMSNIETEDSYLAILKKTKGKWKEDWTKLRKKRKDVELSASKKRKKAW